MKKAIAFLLGFWVLFLLPMEVFAFSTADATEPVRLGQSCSLEIVYRNEETAFSGAEVTLWQVAALTTELSYELYGDFSECPVDLTAIKTAGEWSSAATTLYGYAVADGIAAMSATTDAEGKVLFEGLNCGLYLIAPVSSGNTSFSVGLAAVPGIDDSGAWVYDVTVIPKPSETEPSPDTEYQVTKLWKDYTNEQTRPSSVEIEIYKNGTLAETVTLSGDNNWTYRWQAAATDTWTVAERNVPQGYTVRITQNGHSFLVENSTPGDPEPPKTGDSHDIGLYLVVMLCSLAGITVLLLTKKESRK